MKKLFLCQNNIPDEYVADEFFDNLDNPYLDDVNCECCYGKSCYEEKIKEVIIKKIIKVNRMVKQRWFETEDDIWVTLGNKL